jgi:hypothetical protein
MLKRLSRVLPLLSVVLVLLVVAVGVACQKTEALTADQVVENTVAAQPDVKSLRLSLDLTADVEGSIDGEVTEGSFALSGTAAVDQNSQSMQAEFDLTADISGAIDAGAQLYLVGNYLYMQVSMPEIPQMWLKMPVTSEISGSMPTIEDVTGLIDSAQVELVGEDKAGGVDCYVLSIAPDFEQIQQALAGNPLTEQMGIELPDLEDLISSMSFKMWVAKDTYFVMKARMVMSVELTPEALGAPEGDDHLTVNLTLNMEASQYNQSINIELPVEAQSAIPIDSLSF